MADRLASCAGRTLELLATVDFLAINARNELADAADLAAWFAHAKEGGFTDAQVGWATGQLVELGFLTPSDRIPAPVA